MIIYNSRFLMQFLIVKIYHVIKFIFVMSTDLDNLYLKNKIGWVYADEILILKNSIKSSRRNNFHKLIATILVIF